MRSGRFSARLGLMGALVGLAVATTAGSAGAGTTVMTSPALQRRVEGARGHAGPGLHFQNEHHGPGRLGWHRHAGRGPWRHSWERPYWHRSPHVVPHVSPVPNPGAWVWDGWNWRPR